ncbi:MAG: hypothetical protein FWE34_06230 [Defluviitaleaceae bacterium]|nr:hypothetical protein [Defluviitaleaceae bacterium]
MAAFEFGNYPERPARPPHAGSHHEAPQMEQIEHEAAALAAIPPRLRSEPIMALKIYDSCRYKNCLAPSDLGPALSMGGEPVQAPDNAQSVSIEDLHISRISILTKERNKLRKGYWDIEIQYDFDYHLRYVSRGGVEIGTIPATNSFTQRCSLFGSRGEEVAVTTDLIAGGVTTLGGDPFAIVEAKAIGLAAEIRRDFCRGKHGHGHILFDEEIEPMHGGHRNRNHVFVTIGLFSMVKLFRLVSLLVESRGFVIPDSCGNIMPPNPCDFFEGLDFPMDTFAPPQKPEFMSGESINIPGRPCRAMMDIETDMEEMMEE